MAIDDPVVDAGFEVVDDINIKSVLSNGLHKATCSDPLLPGLGDVFGLNEEGVKRRQLNRMLYFRANPAAYARMMAEK